MPMSNDDLVALQLDALYGARDDRRAILFNLSPEALGDVEQFLLSFTSRQLYPSGKEPT